MTTVSEGNDKDIEALCSIYQTGDGRNRCEGLEGHPFKGHLSREKAISRREKDLGRRKQQGRVYTLHKVCFKGSMKKGTGAFVLSCESKKDTGRLSGRGLWRESLETLKKKEILNILKML